MTQDQEILTLLQHPEEIGKRVGFKDLGPMHGLWIREMIRGEEDYTLQAHRGSYKSSCLAVAISLLLILYPKRNIIFLRKTDNDVTEMLGMVSKILRSDIFQDLVKGLYGQELQMSEESMTHLSTNLWTSPMGAPQLLGLGIKSSITGKHSWYVITDDICNKDDRESRAERERTKRQYDELQNIRNKGGRIINLGTPWHKEDVFSRMPNIHRYDCYQTGLITKEQLEKLRQSMAPSLFAANYELKHIASSEVIFETAPRFMDDAQLLRDGVSHVDAAYGGGDYTAFTCGKRDWDNDVIYLYGRIWHEAVDKVIDIIASETERLMCVPLKCEKNGDKGFVAEEFMKRGVYATTYTEKMNKFIKITTYLKKWWPKIIFLEGTDPEYIDQILNYTENAEHDDAPDSAACVCRTLDNGYY
ncbi:hypothetical protein JS518_14160 [Clostridiales bacterium FE2010]|nr:hypothetical protein JS518_14160 [Clostridiales bacterium FE2010]